MNTEKEYKNICTMYDENRKLDITINQNTLHELRIIIEKYDNYMKGGNRSECNDNYSSIIQKVKDFMNRIDTDSIEKELKYINDKIDFIKRNMSYEDMLMISFKKLNITVYSKYV
jgi:hypothetical protein